MVRKKSKRGDAEVAESSAEGNEKEIFNHG
jgi:hypothetical protein